MISNYTEACDLARKAISQFDDKGTRIEAAAILASANYQNDADKALRLPSGSSVSDLSAGTQTFLDGCRALSKGDFSNAVRELQGSYDIDDDLYTEFFLAKAYLGAHRWKDAELILRDLESSKGRIIADEAYPPVIRPLAHYYLGFVNQQLGNRDMAASYYSKFLDCWKEADGNLKTKEDARKRLAELRNPQKR